MSLTAYLDQGASLGPDAPCLTCGDASMSYGEVQRFSRRVAGTLARSGVRPGDPVAVLSANDPTAFAAVFGIARAGAVWCPVDPRNEAGENRELLDLFGCTALLYQRSFAPLVAAIRAPAAADHPRLPRRRRGRRRPGAGGLADLPRSGVGKVLKRDVRARLLTGGGA
ncbi:AMP-binding protein [Geodermatophilus sp. SYSU D01045]